jgi:hypothetical protein
MVTSRASTHAHGPEASRSKPPRTLGLCSPLFFHADFTPQSRSLPPAPSSVDRRHICERSSPFAMTGGRLPSGASSTGAGWPRWGNADETSRVNVPKIDRLAIAPADRCSHRLLNQGLPARLVRRHCLWHWRHWCIRSRCARQGRCGWWLQLHREDTPLCFPTSLGTPPEERCRHDGIPSEAVPHVA